jgi:hypothetical protein
MTELTGAEVWDVLELMTQERYGVSAVDYMLEWEQGNAENSYVGSHDLSVLAQAISDEEFVGEEEEW